MPKNWKTYKLGDLCTKITDGAHRSPKSVDVDGFPMASVKDLSSFGIQLESARRISKIEFRDLVKQGCKPEVGDVLIAKDGNTALDTVCVQKKEQEVVLLSSVAILRPDKEKIDSNYLKYYLTDPRVINYLKSSFISGAAIPRVVLRDFKLADVNLPPLPEQKAIASILSALDDKIELNLQQNKTLEEMAMTLYKHWFVDFGPFQDGEFVESELGMIPKGWEVKKLDNFVELTMGQSPKSEFYNDNGEGFPFHQGVSNYGIRFPKDVKYSTSGKRVAYEGDVLFSVRAPVGRLNIAKNKIILGRGLASMRMDENNSFLFYTLKTMFSTEDIIGSGTVFNSVNKNDLQNLQFLIPSSDTLLDFKNIIEPIDQMYLESSDEIETLTNLRDTLLPKLISGEIRVKDAQDQLTSVL